MALKVTKNEKEVNFFNFHGNSFNKTNEICYGSIVL